MHQIVVVAHDIRSAHNVGSLLRTAEGIGVEYVWLTGYTPYPAHETDERLPHIARKLDKAIQKTSLGAQLSQAWSHSPEVDSVISELRDQGYIIAGLEQSDTSISLPTWSPPQKVAIVIGREVEGLAQEIVSLCDQLLEIPMFGQKESYNVVQAAAMALYHCRFM